MVLQIRAFSQAPLQQHFLPGQVSRSHLAKTGGGEHGMLLLTLLETTTMDALLRVGWHIPKLQMPLSRLKRNMQRQLRAKLLAYQASRVSIMFSIGRTLLLDVNQAQCRLTLIYHHQPLARIPICARVIFHGMVNVPASTRSLTIEAKLQVLGASRRLTRFRMSVYDTMSPCGRSIWGLHL